METPSPDAVVMRRPGVTVIASRSEVPVTVSDLPENPSSTLVMGHQKVTETSITLTCPGCVVIVV